VKSLATFAHRHFSAALALLWPPQCPRCEASALHPRDRFCEECWSRLRPLDDAEAPGLHAAFAVDSLFLEILSAGKYRGYRSVLRRLSEAAAQRLTPKIPEGVLVPVPLTRARRRERGFNQSEVFARLLAERLGRAVEPRWIERRRGGKPLAGRPRAERAEAIAGSFAATRRFPEGSPPILLIDDVYTTGSTLGECERVLLDAGACIGGKIVLGRAFESRADRDLSPPALPFHEWQR
jgi:predicted amidophosphoribosyltransferase